MASLRHIEVRPIISDCVLPGRMCYNSASGRLKEPLRILGGQGNLNPYLGEALTRWTVRLAVACYLIRVVLDVVHARRTGGVGIARQARWSWTVGCALYLLHVVCAFGFYHQWSHEAAYRHTARQTAEVIGIAWGGGLYFNYAFTLLWILDLAAWWLRDLDSPYRSSPYFWTLHGVFAFMMFNATVVFGPPFWRWLAGIIALLLMVIAVVAHIRARG